MANTLETAGDPRNPYVGASQRAARIINETWPGFFKTPLGDRLTHLLRTNGVTPTAEDPRADWQDWQLRNKDAVHIEVTPPAGEL